MASFYRASVAEFLERSEEYVRDRLAASYAGRGYTSQYTDQTLTWERDLKALRLALRACLELSAWARDWGVLLEFSIPRKELRIDVVLLVRDVVVVLEGKTTLAAGAARRQIEEYALLLHYFHAGSAGRRIVPVIVSPGGLESGLEALGQREFFPQLASYWVAEVIYCSWDGLGPVLMAVEKHAMGQLVAEDWDTSAYSPVPSILEAAVALRSGLSIREIAHSEASEHEIGMVRETIQGIVERARAGRQHAICFLTGVPGSGKTLVGLSLAHGDESKSDAVHFMSGNGPLVQVLQHLFMQESRRSGALASQARAEAKTLIENVHVFARYYTEDNLGAPSNHAIIFDEAQRAWNRAQNLKKFKRDYSEPEMLLRIMERQRDWAVVVALVGGGQEINDGEAGLEEWGRALVSSEKKWVIHASPEVLQGGASTAGHRLFVDGELGGEVETSVALHLRTSNRSLRAEQLATWVNFVLDGEADRAAALGVTDKFPIFLGRDLEKVRSKLRSETRGADRCGLIGSSGAARLRAEGLEPSSSFHAEYPWEHWYLAGAEDVRSSYRCEVRGPHWRADWSHPLVDEPARRSRAELRRPMAGRWAPAAARPHRGMSA